MNGNWPSNDEVQQKGTKMTGEQAQKHTVKKGSVIYFGVPREYPVEMTNSLTVNFQQTGLVIAAYLLWIVNGTESGYLLVLDSQLPPQELADYAGRLCIPFLDDKTLDIVPASSELGICVVQEHKPFYTKGL